jgi:hypothetical protein
MVFTLTNQGATVGTIGSACTGTCTDYTFTTPTGYEFVGFGACTGTTDEVHKLGVYYRAIDCSLTTNIGLSFSGPSSRTIWDGANDAILTLVASDLTVGACTTLVISASYSPSTTTSNII